MFFFITIYRSNAWRSKYTVFTIRNPVLICKMCYHAMCHSIRNCKELQMLIMPIYTIREVSKQNVIYHKQIPYAIFYLSSLQQMITYHLYFHINVPLEYYSYKYLAFSCFIMIFVVSF